ncbi:MAG: alginate lyase family protein [Planctomycetota bacterium]
MRVGRALNLVRHFGPRWLFYRAIYSQQLRWGVLRSRLPVRTWAEQPLAHFLRVGIPADEREYFGYRREAAKFFFSPSSLAANRERFSAWDTDSLSPIEQSVELERGRLQFFSRRRFDGSFPPDWHYNYADGRAVPRTEHWSEIDDFQAGDIKLVWEPNRFAMTYALVRAYARTGDDHYAELFWQLVESWREANPPQQGSNWKCGQEVGLRVMAWCFGLQGFLGSASTTPRRVCILAQMIAVSGQRIESNLSYALSQRNNHGISEAAALWTIGMMFPEFTEASSWAGSGRRLLEREGATLIDDDGAFSQHSVNYHRVMLDNYLWSMRLGEIHKCQFSHALYQRLEAAGHFLYQTQDSVTGRLPNYGHNDGALVLPLSNCDYNDYRPVVQATQYLTTRTKCYASGPWDEELVWLFGSDALSADMDPKPRINFAATNAGYYTMRTPAGFVMTRAPRFRYRPAQADALHVDLWWRGQNIAVDAGTYSYNAPVPWDNALGNTEFHNTVTVDDRDQMERAGRFLWLPWLSSKVTSRQTSGTGKMQYLQAGHDGYKRLKSPARYKRGILRLGEEHWLVIDQVTSAQLHDYRLHWLVADLPFEWNSKQRLLHLHTPDGPYQVRMLDTSEDSNVALVRADPDSPRGWQSRYYHDREPALSLSSQVRECQVRFFTLLGPGSFQVNLGSTQLEIAASELQVKVDLQEEKSEDSSLIESVVAQGSIQERWRL